MSLDLVKTMTFATLHFSVGFTVTYLLTGSIAISTGVALIEPSVNTVVFFFHEQAWRRVIARRSRRAAEAAPVPASAVGAWTLPQGACAQAEH
jgi:uncharacterized membrane protein